MKPIFLFSWFLGYPTLMFCCLVIREYHNKKPPGMQTLLSKSTILLMNLIPLTTLLWILTVFSQRFLAPLDELQSQLLAWTVHLSVGIFLIALLQLIAVKYMSVYHNDSIALMDDDKVMVRIRTSVATVPCLLAILEYGFLSYMCTG